MEAVTIEIAIGVISAFIALELSGAFHGICRWLVRRAAKKLPRAERERFIEENLADLDAMEGPFSRLVNALGAFGAVGAVIRENASGAPSGNRPEPRTLETTEFPFVSLVDQRALVEYLAKLKPTERKAIFWSFARNEKGMTGYLEWPKALGED